MITLRASQFWDVVPGEIVIVQPRKQWSYAGHPYLSGRIVSMRLDVAALALVPWGHVDNRPFLRCLHAYGLCCWRLGRFEEAEQTFERMLWLNPADNQGVRFLIAQVRERVEWKDGE